jgi:hypothetical protein
MSRSIIRRPFFAVLLLLVLSPPAPAFDVWQYPVAADKGAIFAGFFAAYFAYDFAKPDESKFAFDHPEVYLDYVLPVGLPFSFGVSFDSFKTDRYGVGIRPGYHVNFDVPSLDVYLMYTLDLEISQPRMVLDHGVRVGLRYVFYDLFFVAAETGHRFESVNFGIGLRLK